jgi:hypothetical protein
MVGPDVYGIVVEPFQVTALPNGHDRFTPDDQGNDEKQKCME